ncbi:unnamed protein product [Dibothriocephalus latus]|uniref:LIM zinc-binding domain-containing protein n=1 Tax=Dibothriocephalus latus TaxID=60516 RepID=A0A3P6TRR7_DIBLA|nr:unnamed protein product [Dibothriocephalus latus]
MNADDNFLANPIGLLGSMPRNICGGCHAPIDERVFLAVDNQLWHAACLRCDTCRSDLQWDQSCFIYKGRVLCRADYQSLFICPGCDRRLSGDDLVFRLAQTIVYHSECLRCHTCGEVLHLGDTYVLLGGRNVICAKHTTEPVPTTNGKVVHKICDEVAYANQKSTVMPTKRGTQGARKVKKPTKRSSKKTQLDKQFNQISVPPLPCLQQHLPQLQEVASCTDANDDLTAHSTSASDLPDSPDATTHTTSDTEPVFASIRDIFPRNRGSDNPTSASTMEDWFPDRLQEWQQQQQTITPALQDSTHLGGWIFGVSAEIQTTNLPIQMTS